jgi:hypothetical protein
VEVRGWTKFPLVRRYYPHQQVSINRAKYKNNPQGIFAIAPTIATSWPLIVRFLEVAIYYFLYVYLWQIPISPSDFACSRSG